MSPSTSSWSHAARRRRPAGLLPLVVAARFRLAWSRPSVREDAFAPDALPARAHPARRRLEAAARAYVRRQIWRGELRWHPELITHQRVSGFEHLVAARDQGRGVVLNFMHHGHYEGAFASLRDAGVPLHMLVYPHTLLPRRRPGWLKQHIRVASLGWSAAVSADVGSQGITDLLNQGRSWPWPPTCPGRTPLRFVGRDVLGSFGAARFADVDRVPVVVMTSERRRPRPARPAARAARPGRTSSHPQAAARGDARQPRAGAGPVARSSPTFPCRAGARRAAGGPAVTRCCSRVPT